MRLLFLALTMVLGMAPLAHAAPAPDAGTQVDAGPPTNDGLGTSPSWTEILALGGALWTLVSAVVAVTPTKRDDAILRAIAERISFLRPPNVPRGVLGILSLPGTRPRPNGEGL